MLTETRPTVAVIDDDAPVRRGLRRLLQSAGYVVTEFDSGPRFLEHADAAALDCVILDVWLPGMSGSEVFENIERRGLGVPVVFLTAHDDVATGVRAIQRGAVDFLVKPAGERELLGAVRAAIDRRSERARRDGERQRVRSRLAALSSREREVMDHVVRGELNKVIAAELGISEKTVKVHRHRVMEKTGAASVAELVRLADACAEPDPR
jgi:FixJ family two-component response regulator